MSPMDISAWLFSFYLFHFTRLSLEILVSFRTMLVYCIVQLSHQRIWSIRKVESLDKIRSAIITCGYIFCLRFFWLISMCRSTTISADNRWTFRISYIIRKWEPEWWAVRQWSIYWVRRNETKSNQTISTPRVCPSVTDLSLKRKMLQRERASTATRTPRMSAAASLAEAPADLKKPSSSATSLAAPTKSDRMQPTEMLRRRRREYRDRDAR